MSTNLPKLSLLALLCALLLTSPAARPFTVSAQATTVTTNETLTLSTTVINLCNGDLLTLTGTVHVVTQTTTDSSGGVHYKSQQNYENVTGIGTDGTIYRGVSSNNHTVNDNGGNAQQEFTIVNRVRLISQGPSDNALVNVTVHTTINASGQATSTVGNISAECYG